MLTWSKLLEKYVSPAIVSSLYRPFGLGEHLMTSSFRVPQQCWESFLELAKQVGNATWLESWLNLHPSSCSRNLAAVEALQERLINLSEFEQPGWKLLTSDPYQKLAHRGSLKHLGEVYQGSVSSGLVLAELYFATHLGEDHFNLVPGTMQGEALAQLLAVATWDGDPKSLPVLGPTMLFPTGVMQVSKLTEFPTWGVACFVSSPKGNASAGICIAGQGETITLKALITGTNMPKRVLGISANS
jgi:hypothetical protein